MESRYSITDFEIISVLPTELKGLDSQILFDFFDIVIKWGDLGEFEALKFPAFGRSGHGFLIVVWSTFPDTSICLLKKSKFAKGLCFADEGSFIIKTKKLSVIWDTRISLKEAASAIKEIDKIAKAQGFIDSGTGERLFKKLANTGGEVFKVSEAFSNPDNILIFSSEVSDDSIFAQFDHSELVRIYCAGSFKFACLKSNTKAIEETFSAFREIMTTDRMTASSSLILQEEKSKTAVRQNTGQFN